MSTSLCHSTEEMLPSIELQTVSCIGHIHIAYSETLSLPLSSIPVSLLQAALLSIMNLLQLHRPALATSDEETVCQLAQVALAIVENQTELAAGTSQQVRFLTCFKDSGVMF